MFNNKWLKILNHFNKIDLAVLEDMLKNGEDERFYKVVKKEFEIRTKGKLGLNSEDKSDIFKEIIKDQLMMGYNSKDTYSNESSRLIRLSAS